MRRIVTCLLAAVLAGEAAAMGAHGGSHGGVPGIVILAEHRFDPAIQRLLARSELRALPIGDTGLLYLVPVTEDPYRQEMQIRHLHELLNETTREPEPEKP